MIDHKTDRNALRDRLVVFAICLPGVLSLGIAVLLYLTETDIPWQTSMLNHLLHAVTTFALGMYVMLLQSFNRALQDSLQRAKDRRKEAEDE